MIEFFILFAIGIAVGFGATAAGTLYALSRVERLVVSNRPQEKDPLEAELDRLVKVGAVLGWAFKRAPIGFRYGPRERQ